MTKPGRNAQPAKAGRTARPKDERGWYDRVFTPGANWLLARGIHPNHFTFLQLPVFLLQVYAATHGWRWTFVLSILLIIILDGGDGILARVGKLASKTGAVLDSLFDTAGIAIIMWGATRFFPEPASDWLLLLFAGNLLLFLQNALLDHKAIAYVRGPVLVAVAYPQTLLFGLLLPTLMLLVLIGVRLPQTLKAIAQPARLP